jgi:hypothetical protein
VFDVSGTPDEIDPGIKVTRRSHRPVDDDGGRVVTTHRVDSNPDLQCFTPKLACVGDVGIVGPGETGRLISHLLAEGVQHKRAAV